MRQDIVAFIRKEKFLLAIAAVTAVLRVPSLFEPLWYGDEAIYLTVGQQILRGDVLYVDVFDHKPPGIYYLTAASLALFGHSVAAIKVVLLGWSVATLFALYFLARRLLDGRAAALAVAILSLLVTPTWLEGDIFGSEILMILTTCLGILLGLRHRPFLAGICFGLSLLFKVPAIFDFGAFFVFVALGVEKGGERGTLSQLGRLTAGLLAPVLVTVAYFAAEGALPEYFESAFVYNIDYTGSGNDLVFEHGRMVLNAVPAILLVIALAVPALRRWRTGEGSTPDGFQFMLLWLVFSFYGVLLGGRPYEHYLIQVAPAFSLLAAFALTRGDVRRYASAVALLAVAAVTMERDFDLDRKFYINYYPNFVEYASGAKSFDEYATYLDRFTAGNYRLSSFLRDDSAGADASIYLYSDQPSIYFRTRMDPASKYVAYYHIAWDDEKKRTTAEEIADARPRYIVTEDPRISPFPQLERMIAEDYRFVRSEGILQVYKRVE
jgi:hypothetical protein